MSVSSIAVRSKVIALRKYNPCATLADIGEKVGVTYERVRQILSSQGLPTRRFRQKYLCLHCGREMGKKRFYCSQECWSASRKILVACDSCGKVFEHSAKRLVHVISVKGQSHMFCSRKCRGVYVGTHFGFATHPENRKRKHDHGAVLELYKDGLTHQRIGEQLGMSVGVSVSIIYELRRKGVSVPYRGRRGNQRWNWGEVERLRGSGLTPEEISQRLGAPLSTIRVILWRIKKREESCPGYRLGLAGK